MKLSHWLFVVAFVTSFVLGLSYAAEAGRSRREAEQFRAQLEEMRRAYYTAQEIARHTMRLCSGVERRRSLEVRP